MSRAGGQLVLLALLGTGGCRSNMRLSALLYLGHGRCALTCLQPCGFCALALLLDSSNGMLLAACAAIQLANESSPLFERCCADPEFLLLAQCLAVVTTKIVDSRKVRLRTLFSHASLAEQRQCALLTLSKKISDPL